MWCNKRVITMINWSSKQYLVRIARIQTQPTFKLNLSVTWVYSIFCVTLWVKTVNTSISIVSSPWVLSSLAILSFWSPLCDPAFRRTLLCSETPSRDFDESRLLAGRWFLLCCCRLAHHFAALPFLVAWFS